MQIYRADLTLPVDNTENDIIDELQNRFERKKYNENWDDYMGTYFI